MSEAALTEFLTRGFGARQRCGARSVTLDADADVPGIGGSAGPERACLIAAADFAVALLRAGVTDAEHAALWTRFELEGRPGAISSASTAADFAEFMARHWPEFGRYSAKAVKMLLWSAEIKLLAHAPWRAGSPGENVRKQGG